MLSKVITGSINGMDIDKVTVETDFSQGLPYLSLVGLPDMTVRESKERIRSAIINSGFVFPMKRITVNLSPADSRKSGSHFDLPMAVGILKSSGGFESTDMDDTAFIGELSLDGTINPVEGCVALILGLKEKGIRRVYIPEGNVEEVISVENVTIYIVDCFVRLMDHLMGISMLRPLNRKRNKDQTQSESKKFLPDYCDIQGHEAAKRAMQICAAGWHDILMTGPPGAGKTMLASRLNTILPEADRAELDEITKIYSIAGEMYITDDRIKQRPFRAPHHTVTAVSLMGGGSVPRPGELSLAHGGVLFLDELPEFEKKALDMLRQPLEDGFINLSRISGRHRYPCRFILVCAMNPCPCGHYNDPEQECTCNTSMRINYENKISGPLRDRIDIHLSVHQDGLKSGEFLHRKNISSAELKAGVERACIIQRNRYKYEDFRYNSQIPDMLISKYCKMDHKAELLLDQATARFNLSGRTVIKLIRVSRSIADLDGEDNIEEKHVAESISYRIDSASHSASE